MILKFKEDAARTAFLTKVRSEREDIYRGLRPARRLPQVVATGLNQEQIDWVNRHVPGFGKAYADVQFETLEPAQA